MRETEERDRQTRYRQTDWQIEKQKDREREHCYPYLKIKQVEIPSVNNIYRTVNW